MVLYKIKRERLRYDNQNCSSSKNHPDKGKINIEVKVLSLWNQYYSNNNPSKLSGIDMILMDEHSCNDDGINFISFKDFVEAKIDQSYSFDVIGRLIQNKDITVLNPNNAPKHILEFQLQDVTGTIIPCILWNDLAIKQTLYFQNTVSPNIRAYRQNSLIGGSGLSNSTEISSLSSKTKTIIFCIFENVSTMIVPVINIMAYRHKKPKLVDGMMSYSEANATFTSTYECLNKSSFISAFIEGLNAYGIENVGD
ncbi:replication protein A 70 kDa DNA-binding subunit-like protein [Tanacetum coccineum]